MALPIAVPPAGAGAADATAKPAWPLAQRIAFRFTFAYAVLFAFPFPLSLDPTTRVQAALGDPFVRLQLALLPRFARLVFGIQALPSVGAFGGSGLADWMLVAENLTLAAIATAVWSIAARRTTRHDFALGALRIYLRWFLASMMFSYGFVKVFPAQFGFLGGDKLTATIGDLSPSELMWTFLAASPGYTIFSGLTEVLGGALLLFRRTATLGAVIVLGVMANVLAMNVFYDVGVQLGSLHYLLCAVALVVADGQRLADFFVLGRPVDAQPLTPRTRATRIAKAVLLALLVVPQAMQAWDFHVRFTTPPPHAGVFTVAGDPAIVRIGIGNRVRIVPADGSPSFTLLADWSDPSSVELRTKMRLPGERLTVTDLGDGKLRLDGVLLGKPESLTLTPAPEPPLSSANARWID